MAELKKKKKREDPYGTADNERIIEYTEKLPKI